MNKSESATNTSSVCCTSIGPKELIDELGLMTVVTTYAVILFLISCLITYALYHRYLGPVNGRDQIYLTIFPAVLLLPTFCPLISPNVDRLVLFTQGLLTNFAYLAYMDNALSLIETKHLLVDSNRKKREFPMENAPCCYLHICRKQGCISRPKMSLTLLDTLHKPVYFLITMEFCLLLMYSGLAFNGIGPDCPSGFFAIYNIPLALIIPVWISCSYCYKVFCDLSRPCLRGTYPRLRGDLLVLMFAIPKITRLVFLVLQDKDVTPKMDCIETGQLLKPLVQLFLFTFFAILIPPLYSRKWTLNKDEIEDDEELELKEQNTAPETETDS